MPKKITADTVQDAIRQIDDKYRSAIAEKQQRIHVLKEDIETLEKEWEEKKQSARNYFKAKQNLSESQAIVDAGLPSLNEN